MINKRIILIIIIFLLLTFIITPVFAVLTRTLIVAGNVTIILKEEDSKINIEYYINKTDNMDGDFKYEITFLLTNIGEDDFHFWDIKFNVPNDITNIQIDNADYKLLGTELTLSNLENKSLLTGNAVRVTMQFTTLDDSYDPRDFSMPNCLITYEKLDSLNITNLEVMGGLVNTEIDSVYEFLVTNVGTKDTSYWSLELLTDELVTIFSANTNYVNKGNVIIISSNDQNKVIPAGFSEIITLSIYSESPINFTIGNITAR